MWATLAERELFEETGKQVKEYKEITRATHSQYDSLFCPKRKVDSRIYKYVLPDPRDAITSAMFSEEVEIGKKRRRTSPPEAAAAEGTAGTLRRMG